MAARPVHPASNNAVKVRAASLPIGRGRLADAAPLTAVGRNVASTGGTGAVAKLDRAFVGDTDARRAASCARWRISCSTAATRTRSGGTTTLSCGSSVGFGVGVDCIGAPYLSNDAGIEFSRPIALDARSTLHPGLTKPR